MTYTPTGFEDTIEIMSSVAKPRKLVIKGSDGKMYRFLCKPTDDLRKDSRLMECTSLINRLLQRDAESRKRNLRGRRRTMKWEQKADRIPFRRANVCCRATQRQDWFDRMGSGHEWYTSPS